MEDTRADLHETVNALERKLTIGQLLDEVMGRIDGGGTVGSAADTVGDAIRRNPIPIGLVGAGIAWMAIDRATRSEGEQLRREYGEQTPGTERRTEMRRGPYRGDEIGSEEPSIGERAAERVSEGADRVAATVSSARDRTASAADEAVGAVRDRASDVADTVSHEASRAKRGLQSAMQEQPLALGAVAFGLGLASGLAAPRTRPEDEAMGELSDAVVKETKSTARDAVSSARDVAKDAARAAKREADRQDVVGELKDSARRIGDEAKETARRRASEEDVDAEGMQRRTAEAAERARERVGQEGDRA